MNKTGKVLILCSALLSSILFACTAKEEQGMAEPNAKASPAVKSLRTKRGEIRYFRFGNPAGKPFVLLPGLSLKSVMDAAAAVESAYALIGEKYNVYVIDRLSVYPEEYDVEDMAEDTLEALEILKLSDITLMGVSQGGMMAQLMAAEQPEKFKALILCSTASSMKNANLGAFTEWHRLAEEKNGTGLMESFGQYVYTPEFFEAYKDVIIAQGENVSDAEFANFLISVDGTAGFDCSEALSSIACPVFVLGAGEDQVLGVQASYDLMHTLNCDGYIYEGKGHGVYDEAPDYRSRIMEFLNRH